MEQDQQFLEYVVKALVDNPNDVKVRRTVDEMGVLLTLAVHRDDMGKIIGRSGATAKAIRTILRVVGMKHDARVNLKIEEPEGSTRGFAAQGAADDDNTDDGSYKKTEKNYSEPPKDRTLEDVIGDLKV